MKFTTENYPRGTALFVAAIPVLLQPGMSAATKIVLTRYVGYARLPKPTTRIRKIADETLNIIAAGAGFGLSLGLGTVLLGDGYGALFFTFVIGFYIYGGVKIIVITTVMRTSLEKEVIRPGVARADYLGKAIRELLAAMINFEELSKTHLPVFITFLFWPFMSDPLHAAFAERGISEIWTSIVIVLGFFTWGAINAHGLRALIDLIVKGLKKARPGNAA